MALNDFLTGVAQAIRDKTGGTSPIKATDFATAIRAIEAGTVTVKPELFAPTITLEKSTNTLTIADEKNGWFATDYSIFVNGDSVVTTSSGEVNIASYISDKLMYEIKVMANENTKCNASSFSNLVNGTYVSLGDSIAYGQACKSGDLYQYPSCLSYQYNTSQSGYRQDTLIVEDCYTDKIRDYLSETYGQYVKPKSFAVTGDKVSGLITKLGQSTVINEIKQATIVTVCIGANEILGEISGDVIESYITQGNPALESLKEKIDGNLATLRGQGDNSLSKLFSRLAEINPTAKYIFTTIYNPYKYLKIGQNFFTAWFNDIAVALGSALIFSLEAFLGIATTSLVTSRVNALGSWVEGRITDLNTVIRNAISAYANDNFTVVDTKRLFDTFPDNVVSSTYHYNDLVNVDVTEGFAWNSFNWGVLYPAQNWVGATAYYTAKFVEANWDLSKFFELVITDMVTKVIMPRIDPHPRTHGQYVLSRSYLSSSMFGDKAVPLNKFTITYDKGANGTGSMASEEIWAVDGVAYVNIKSNTFAPTSTSHHFNGWKDQYGNSYSNGEFIKLTSNLTLTAQWRTDLKLTYFKTYGIEGNTLQTIYPASSNGGPVYKDGSPYYLRIEVNGTPITDGMGDYFTDNGNSPKRTITVEKGSSLYISLVNVGSDQLCEIWHNGSKVAGPSEYASYPLPNGIQRDITLQCIWKASGYSFSGAKNSYWVVGISD